jgi:hypothetical protein
LRPGFQRALGRLKPSPICGCGIYVSINFRPGDRAREGLLRRWLMHPNVSDEPRDCFSYARVR